MDQETIKRIKNIKKTIKAIIRNNSGEIECVIFSDMVRLDVVYKIIDYLKEKYGKEYVLSFDTSRHIVIIHSPDFVVTFL